MLDGFHTPIPYWHNTISAFQHFPAGHYTTEQFRALRDLRRIHYALWAVSLSFFYFPRSLLFCFVFYPSVVFFVLCKNSDTVEYTDLNDLFNLGLWVEYSFFVKNAILRKKKEKNPDSCKGNLIVFGHEKTAWFTFLRLHYRCHHHRHCSDQL